jgi:hypothetical protein
MSEKPNPKLQPVRDDRTGKYIGSYDPQTRQIVVPARDGRSTLRGTLPKPEKG